MKKISLAIALGFLISGSVFATNGYMYLENVNNVFGSDAKVQFKIEAKTPDGKVIKTIETDNIKAKQFVDYKLADFGLSEGSLDLYARDLDKSSSYSKCVDGFPYFEGITVVIHGWSDSKNAVCEIAEDANSK